MSGVPRLNTPPPISRKLLTESQEKKIVAPKPIRVSTENVANFDDFAQPWTRSPPKKFDQEPVMGKWQFNQGFKLVLSFMIFALHILFFNAKTKGIFSCHWISCAAH